MKTVLFALLLLASACAQIDYAKEPPEDWPVLKVIDLPVTSAEFGCYCGPFDLACALVRFDLREGYIVYTGTLPTWVREHEEAHLKGRPHFGDNETTDAWEHWKRTGRHLQGRDIAACLARLRERNKQTVRHQ